MKSGLPEIFCALFPTLKLAAYRRGYALLVHGSMTRDFDLVAVPWIKGACSPEYLVKALAREIKGARLHDYPESKPHGRRGWIIFIHGTPENYIDISVMPRKD